MVGEVAESHRYGEAARSRWAYRDGSDVPTTTFESHSCSIDLDTLYRARHEQSELADDGERLFRGNARDVRAVKRLLHDLFDVPVAEKMNPINHAIRSECRDRLAELGWATKRPGRSATCALHRRV